MIFTIMDIETTGLNKEKDDILEVGYLQVNNDKEILRSGTLYFYKEGFDIESDAQEVHGLTREFLKQYEDDFEDNIIRLFTLFRSGIIVGKNSDKFDIPFIQKFLQKYAPDISPVAILDSLDMQTIFAPVYRKWYESTYGKSAGRKVGKLGELMEVIGYTHEQVKQEFLRDIAKGDDSRAHAHGALYDVYMTYLLFKDAIDNKRFDISSVGLKLSPEEALYREACLATDECVGAGAEDFPYTFQKAFFSLDKYYYMYKHTRVTYELSSYLHFMKYMSNPDLIEVLLTENKGKPVIGVEGKPVVFSIEFMYWCLDWYARTEDEKFLKIGRAFCAYMGFEVPKFGAEPKISLNMDNYEGNVLRTYLEYLSELENSYGLEIPEILQSPNDFTLYNTNPTKFWRLLAPAGKLMKEMFWGYITWDMQSVYCIMNIIALQGGLM